MAKVKNLTAAQEILIAAAETSARDADEFSEWDLTVSAWRKNKNRFGCRGYEDEYPDHKRVMMEIMTKNKKDSPIRRGWMEKSKPNHYRITALGKSEAERLLRVKGGVKESERSAQPIYDAVAPYIEHRVFRQHCKDPEEPKTWLGAAAFLGLSRNDGAHLNDRFQFMENSLEAANNWLDETRQGQIRRGVTGGGITIRKEDLHQLTQFIEILKVRFELQFDAIRKSSL